MFNLNVNILLLHVDITGAVLSCLLVLFLLSVDLATGLMMVIRD